MSSACTAAPAASMAAPRPPPAPCLAISASTRSLANGLPAGARRNECAAAAAWAARASASQRHARLRCCRHPRRADAVHRAGVAGGAHQRAAGQGDALFWREHMDDALVGVVQVEQPDAEVARAVAELSDEANLVLATSGRTCPLWVVSSRPRPAEAVGRADSIANGNARVPQRTEPTVLGSCRGAGWRPGPYRAPPPQATASFSPPCMRSGLPAGAESGAAGLGCRPGRRWPRR